MLQNLLLNSLEQGMVYGIMALGVYITFKILKFSDLTVDGSFPLGAAIAAALIVGGYHPFFATLAALLAGALAGCITGILNTKAGISDLLSGILTMTSLYSINLRIMGRPNTPLLNQPTIYSVIDTFVKGIWPAFPSKHVYLIFFIIFALLIKFIVDAFLKTQMGFALRATGDNPQMIRSQGVNTDLAKIIGLVISNSLVALSGALVAQYLGFADAGMGVGTIVAGLASVIIGDTLLGGRTVFISTLGVLFGSFLYRFSISLVLSFRLAQASDLKLFTAIVVVIALTAPQIKQALKLRIKGCDSYGNS
ncbi:MAG: ABC transporter permease [Tepidanaerobacter acetatoxydans]|jgi:putative ABC transport system permease protein|uniref:ABC transporter permease n=1 Tax=Tepidanaerobacter TaxID=499228 RepID=UPI000A49C24D|nr:MULTISPECIES: ABC transporter permease [Tepidanaerobacter]NLU10046.1 ABC transporter permease [Tepidanaerobacter acetatoxydans]